MKNVVDLMGRILLSAIFIAEAFDSIIFFDSTREKMDLFGLTWQQDILLSGAIFLLFFGGILVLLGYRARLGAVMLMLYWIPVTFIVHSFWLYPEDEYRLQSILFWKNIAILGGLLMILANGSGRFSIKKLFATTRVPR